MSWETELVRRYPLLFRAEQSECAPGYPCVGDGWQLIVEKAIERIDAAVRGLHGDAKAVVAIRQIKEKFGGLRIYAEWTAVPADVGARIQEAIDLAAARSFCTCELCGARGQIHNDDGWFATRCDRHAEGEPVEPKQGEPDLHIKYVVADGKMRVLTCRRYDRERDVFVEAQLPPGEQWAEGK